MLFYRPDVTWRRGDGEMITVKTAGKKIKSEQNKQLQFDKSVPRIRNDLARIRIQIQFLMFNV